MTLSVNLDDLSQTAKDAVRLSFNPSQRADVQLLKSLAAAMITVLEGVREEKTKTADGPSIYEVSTAITHIQTASMWSVLAATKGS